MTLACRGQPRSFAYLSPSSPSWPPGVHTASSLWGVGWPEREGWGLLPGPPGCRTDLKQRYGDSDGKAAFVEVWGGRELSPEQGISGLGFKGWKTGCQGKTGSYEFEEQDKRK